MGILTGTETLFFLLGGMTVILIGGLVYLVKKYPFRWYATLLAVIGILIFLFGIAWCVSSILEGEPRAAGMGLLIFGLLSLLCLGFTRRFVVKNLKPTSAR
jgi:hypothetical protein